jgi:hypothetical protein
MPIEVLAEIDGRRYTIWARSEDEARERIEILKMQTGQVVAEEDGEVSQ